MTDQIEFIKAIQSWHKPAMLIATMSNMALQQNRLTLKLTFAVLEQLLIRKIQSQIG